MRDEDDTPPNMNKWKGLMRGSILSTTTQKIYSYINLADQKAMGLIVLNSIIIPVAMNAHEDPQFTLPSTIAIITSVASILMAIACIFPKRRSGTKPGGELNYLHFSDIGSLSEKQYLEQFLPIYNDTSALSECVIKDIHDVSRRVLVPKFKQLKLSYKIFFIGNLAAVITFFIQSWS